MKRLLHLILALVAAHGLVQQAQAAYPEKPVTIVVPQTPGGGTDMLTRLLAQRLSERWVQPVVVENKPGAGGALGLELVAKTPNDGYTLVMSSDGPQAINVSLYKSLPYDAVNDFTPIATVGSIAFLIAAGKDSPARSFGDFVKLAKASPGLTFGSAGNGSLNHLIGEMINQSTDMKLRHVPYKGSAPAINDLLGGHVSAVVASVPSIATQVDAGKVRALAVSSATRSLRLPDVPTISEFGYAKFGVSPWIGLLGPANIPPAIVEKINADVNAILKEPEVIKAILAKGMEPFPGTAAQFKQLIKDDIAKWGVVVRKGNIRID